MAAAVSYLVLTSLGAGERGAQRENRLSVDVIAENLVVPWSVAVLEDGSFLVTERRGVLLRILPGGRRLRMASFDVASVGEAGLLGLALHPEYPNDRRAYLYMSVYYNEGIVNRVVSVEINKDLDGVRGGKIVVDKIPGAVIHDGGRVRFGPDKLLYITTGDAAKPRLSQDLSSLAGKILRVDDEGGVPDDNPFPNSPVYSYGHRNPQGIDWHPPTNLLFSSEHGPIGRDEVNIIRAGGNYGWPYMAGLEGEEREGLIKPVIDFGPTSIAPAGASFASKGPGWLKDDFLIACLRGSRLVRVRVRSDGGVEGYESLLTGVYGRLRDVVPHPDGGLIVLTSNRDGRGVPRPGDDKMLLVT